MRLLSPILLRITADSEHSPSLLPSFPDWESQKQALGLRREGCRMPVHFVDEI